MRGCFALNTLYFFDRYDTEILEIFGQFCK